MMRFNTIRDLDGFARLRSEWNTLVEHSEVDHAFMRHEWFDCWIKHLGRPRSLAIETAWQDGQLVGIAPLHIKRQVFRKCPVNVLCFLSSGLSPRCNFVMHDSCPVESLLDRIFKSRGWDLIVTTNLDSTTKTARAYDQYLQDKRFVQRFVETGRTSPYLMTDGTYKAYFESLSKSFQIHTIRGLKKLDQAKSYEVRKITHYAELLPIFSQLVDASARSWKVAEGTDLGSLPDVQRFLLEVAQQSGDPGLLETWVLWIDKQVAAFDIYARGPRSLSLLRTDFDLAFRHYGPGNGLRVAIMKDLFEREQVWEYDFGGQNYPYKLRWTKSVRRHNDVTASRPGLFGNVLLLGKRMLPLARKVRSFKKT